MKINLEILKSAYLFDETSIDTTQIKDLVPNMMMRRRLTKASKITLKLLSSLDDYTENRIIYGSAFGELEITANIINAIKDKQSLSPTDFQNSVYNTAISYLSILMKNKSEMLTISSGDKTSLNVLKAGAIKSIDGDTLVLICTETINIPNIEQVNKCVKYLESGVVLVVKTTSKEANISIQKSESKGIPNSMSEMLYVAQKATEVQNPIVEILL